MEERQHRVKHITHHLLEVVRSLYRSVHLLHALQEPEMALALLIGPLALDRDARQVGNVFDDILLRWRRTPGLARVDREGCEYPAIRAGYGRRPTRSEPVS